MPLGIRGCSKTTPTLSFRLGTLVRVWRISSGLVWLLRRQSCSNSPQSRTAAHRGLRFPVNGLLQSFRSAVTPSIVVLCAKGGIRPIDVH